MKTVTVELSNVYSQIPHGISDSLVKKLKDICSYHQEVYDPGSFSQKKVQVSLFNESKLIFPTGLYSRVLGIIEELGYKPDIKDYRTRPNIDVDKFVKGMLKRADDFGLSLREYQIDGILSAIEEPSGLFNYATGSGKTVIFSFLLLAYDLPTMIVVNKKELAEQIRSELSLMTGRSVGYIGDGVWSPSKWTVAIVNSLNSGLNHNSEGHRIRTLRYLEKVQMFVGDEIHHLGARSWKDIARACQNASVRFGFSGTCYHPDSEDLYLVAFTGEIISEVTPSFLIKKGYLAVPHIYMPRIECPDEYKYKDIRNWQQTRKLLIRENRAVNESGVEFIWKMYKKGISVIYFSGNDVEYGNIIHNMLLDAGVIERDLKFMTGRESSEIRRKSLFDFKNNKLRILGGTSIYDEGIDVPHAGSGANFGQGYSDINTTQRIGRVLRKIKPEGAIDVDVNDKQIKYYWDPSNKGNHITEKHSQFREHLYEEHDAFKLFKRQYGYKSNV